VSDSVDWAGIAAGLYAVAKRAPCMCRWIGDLRSPFFSVKVMCIRCAELQRYEIKAASVPTSHD